MKNKIIISILSLTIFFSIFKTVNAVVVAPSPICEITAEVLEIEKTRTQRPDISPENQTDYYSVKLNVSSITTYKQISERLCDADYIELVEKAGAILLLTEHNKNPIKEGQKIQTKVQFKGDAWFGGYFLSNTQTLEEAVTVEKDEDMIIEKDEEVAEQDREDEIKVDSETELNGSLIQRIINWFRRLFRLR